MVSYTESVPNDIVGKSVDHHLGIKLDTAFEQNFRDMQAKIKQLPKKEIQQNYQFVTTDEEFGGIQVMSKGQEIMKKIGTNIGADAIKDGPPV